VVFAKHLKEDSLPRRQAVVSLHFLHEFIVFGLKWLFGLCIHQIVVDLDEESILAHTRGFVGLEAFCEVTG